MRCGGWPSQSSGRRSVARSRHFTRALFPFHATTPPSWSPEYLRRAVLEGAVSVDLTQSVRRGKNSAVLSERYENFSGSVAL